MGGNMITIAEARSSPGFSQTYLTPPPTATLARSSGTITNQPPITLYDSS